MSRVIKLIFDDLDSYSVDTQCGVRRDIVQGRFLQAYSEIYKETKYFTDNFYKVVGSVDRLFDFNNLYACSKENMKKLSFQKLETYLRDEFGNVSLFSPEFDSKGYARKIFSKSKSMIFNPLTIETTEEYIKGKKEVFITCDGKAGNIKAHVECKPANGIILVSTVVVDESGTYKPVYLQNTSLIEHKRGYTYTGDLRPVVASCIDWVSYANYGEIWVEILQGARKYNLESLSMIESRINERFTSNPQRLINYKDYTFYLKSLATDIEAIYRCAKDKIITRTLAPNLSLDRSGMYVKFSWFM